MRTFIIQLNKKEIETVLTALSEWAEMERGTITGKPHAEKMDKVGNKIAAQYLAQQQPKERKKA